MSQTIIDIALPVFLIITVHALPLGSQCCQPAPATQGLSEIHYI